MKEMLNRLQMMFEYKNLPDTIPSSCLETFLLVNGQCIIAQPKGSNIPQCYSPDSLYAFTGAPGGEPDAYLRPSKYMVSNPSLQYTNEFVIYPTSQLEQDAVLMRNDTMWQGLYSLMSRYASLIAENLLTIRVSDILLRITTLLTAPNDKDKIAAELYLKKIENGELGVIAENRFLDGISMQNPPTNNGSYLTQFIELHQYLSGRFYNDIGLNANYNMKRESLSETETGLNEDSLPTLAENMLKCRQEDLTLVNKMFGTSISVDFASSWKQNVIEKAIKLKQLESDSSQLGEDNGNTSMVQGFSAQPNLSANRGNGENTGNTSGASRGTEETVRIDIGESRERSESRPNNSSNTSNDFNVARTEFANTDITNNRPANFIIITTTESTDTVDKSDAATAESTDTVDKSDAATTESTDAVDK